MKQVQHYPAIDSLKFIFSVIIVYFHLLHSNMKGTIGTTDVYTMLSKACDGSALIVECFLIIAGFFVYRTFLAGRQTLAGFSVSRVVRLWPVFAFYVLCAWALTSYTLENSILDLSFMRCTGISLEYKGIIWYIPPFFWCSILLFAIMRVLGKERALLVVALLTYVAYCLNLNNLKGGVGRHVVYSWVSLGMLRVLGGLGVGILIGAGKEYLNGSFSSGTMSRWRFMGNSIVELTCLSMLIYNFIIVRLFGNTATVVILFSLLFIIMTNGGGIVSRCLGWAPLAKLGKYCYSIYVMQQIAFWCMARTIWKWGKAYWLSEPVLAVAVSTLIAVAIGIITYYLVEQPCANWYKRRKMNRV